MRTARALLFPPGMLRELHFAWGAHHVVVSTYGVAVLGAIAAGATLTLRRARDRDVAWLAVGLAAPAALLGAATLHRLTNDTHGGPSGLSSVGGVAGIIVSAWLTARLAHRSPADVLDALAPGALLALAVGRLGCFCAGCCFGAPTAMPWGVVFPALGPPARHPLQLYASAADVLLLVRLPHAGAPRGTVAAAAATGWGAVRAALETLRDPAAADVLPGGLVTLAQVAALVVAACGLAYARAPLRLGEPSTMAPPRRRAPQWRTRSR